MPNHKKRSDARAGHRTKAEKAQTIKVNLDEVLAGIVEIPAPPTREVVDKGTGEISIKHDWHPAAENLYLSLAKSGQCIYYEPSDWEYAWTLCEALSREFSPKPVVTTNEDGYTEVQMIKGPVNGAVMAQVLKGMGALMATEGDRRKINLELNRKAAQDAKLAGDGKVVSITQNRKEIFNG